MHFKKLVAATLAATLACTTVAVPTSAATTTTSATTTAVQAKKVSMYQDATKTYKTTALDVKNAKIKVSDSKVAKATYTTKGKIKITALGSGSCTITLYNKNTGKAVDKFKVAVSKNIFTAIGASPIEELVAGPVKMSGTAKLSDANSAEYMDFGFDAISIPDVGAKIDFSVYDTTVFSGSILEEGIYIDATGCAEGLRSFTKNAAVDEETTMSIEMYAQYADVMFPETLGAIYISWEDLAGMMESAAEALEGWQVEGTMDPQALETVMTQLENFNVKDFCGEISKFVTKTVGSSVYGKKDRVYSLSLDSEDFAKLIEKIAKEYPDIVGGIDLKSLPTDISSYDTFKYTKSSITCTSDMNIEDANTKSTFKMSKYSKNTISRPAKLTSFADYMAYLQTTFGE